MEEIVPEKKPWNEILQNFNHDVYHTLQYLKHAAQEHPGSEVIGLFYLDALTARKIFLPIMLRPLPSMLGGAVSGFDISVPYGYGGPIADNNVDNQTFERFFKSLYMWAQKREIVSGFLRWHPLFQIPESTPDNLIVKGVTVAVDLELFDGAVDDASRATHRSEIRWLERNGYQVVWDDWQFFQKFQQLYTETMTRLKSSEIYKFNSTYFQNFKEEIGPMLHLGVVLNNEGDVAAAALFTECKGIVQYSLSASDERFRRKSPTKLLLGDARLWSRERGNKWLHLGGGLGAQKDSLYKFKSGFSNCEKKFAISKFIFDEIKYEQLVRQAGSLKGKEDARHFPQYRENITN